METTARELLRKMVADMKLPREERKIEIMKHGSFHASQCFITDGKQKGKGAWDYLTDEEIDTASDAKICEHIILLSSYCFRQR